MTAVLGIDAAWTDTEPSGIALIECRDGRWFHIQSSSSYGAFVGQRAGTSMGSPIDAAALLDRCKAVSGGQQPQVVAVDMPLGLRRITARRPADAKISRAFGHAKCSVHSPTMDRPGIVGMRLIDEFTTAGYVLEFGRDSNSKGPALIEVYPHVALLDLMQAKERLPYKCTKTNSYWKGVTLTERRRKLLEQWRRIERALARHIDGIELDIPPPNYDGPLSHLKAYEDRLDALICAWVGALYLEGKAQPLGDIESAIWVPSAAMKYARQP